MIHMIHMINMIDRYIEDGLRNYQGSFVKGCDLAKG